MSQVDLQTTLAKMADEAGPLDPNQYRVDDADKGFFSAAISPDEDVVRQRVLDIQKKAYEACPYPCIKKFNFISLRMKGHPTYKEVIAHGGKDSALFLDLGCCMGTDVRNAVYEGYPASQIVGSDVVERYLTLGKELYNDKETGKIKFIAADVFDLPSAPPTAPRLSNVDGVTQLDDLAGSFTFIYIGSIFHFFSAQKQKELALRLLRLWTREPGAIIFGRHQGREEEGYLAQDHAEWGMYGHSPKTFTAMWKEAIEEFEGEGAADKITVEVGLQDWVQKLGSVNLSHGTSGLEWTVRRV